MHDPLAHLPGYSLRRAASTMMAELATRLAPLDLRIGDASVLLVIDDQPGITASALGRTLDIQRANMVPLLARLETAGLILRVPLDRKSLSLQLTTTGRERFEQARAVTQQFEADLMAKVPAEHRAHLVPALNALWRA